jgi:hypothetical protein
VDLARAGALVVCLLTAATAAAQDFEIAPFGGYRFGGDFFELLAQQALDLDGAPAFGVAVDVPTRSGVQFEALFTHQDARVLAAEVPYGSRVRWRMTVQHWQAGALRELDTGRVRPFLTGSAGLTRFATRGDNEIRFAVSVGGGVKLFPASHVGIRLGSQVFATFVDASAQFFACSPGVCVADFHAHVLWQIEFTAGLIVRFR